MGPLNGACLYDSETKADTISIDQREVGGVTAAFLTWGHRCHRRLPLWRYGTASSWPSHCASLRATQEKKKIAHMIKLNSRLTTWHLSGFFQKCCVLGAARNKSHVVTLCVFYTRHIVCFTAWKEQLWKKRGECARSNIRISRYDNILVFSPRHDIYCDYFFKTIKWFGKGQSSFIKQRLIFQR